MILSAQNFCLTYKKGEKSRFLTTHKVMLLLELFKLNEAVVVAMLNKQTSFLSLAEIAFILLQLEYRHQFLQFSVKHLLQAIY